MKKNWKLKVTEAIGSNEIRKVEEKISALKWVIKKYNYKDKLEQKEKYIKTLEKIFFIKKFEINEEKKEIYYVDENGVKRTRKGKIGRISKIPMFHSKKDVCVYTAIKALMSGKKQEACSITVKKRRLQDGSYKGIEKTMKSVDLEKRQLKIAENRKKNKSYKPANKKTLEQIKKELKAIAPDYIVKSKEYIGNKTKMDFICNNGHYFNMRWNNITQGQKCPHCNIYKNEEECREILQEITGKKFKKCRPFFLTNPETGAKLELDGFNEELKMAFEYDGRQHYESVDYFGGEEYFLILQKNDEIKEELCKKNSVKLIRIPYWIEDKKEYIKEKIWQK